jgi:hypothetical protein
MGHVEFVVERANGRKLPNRLQPKLSDFVTLQQCCIDIRPLGEDRWHIGGRAIESCVVTANQRQVNDVACAIGQHIARFNGCTRPDEWTDHRTAPKGNTAAGRDYPKPGSAG